VNDNRFVALLAGIDANTAQAVELYPASFVDEEVHL